MKQTVWDSHQQRRTQPPNRQPSDALKRNIPVPKAALEDAILHLLATAAELQQRQDLNSALQLYEAAMAKIKAHNLNSEKFLSGTSKKPAPLNTKTPLEWSLHVGDIASAILLLGNANAALGALRNKVSVECIGSILDSGASVEHRIGPVGRTLLLQEASEGRHAGVCLALDRGATVTCMDDNGDTALALALRSQEPQAGLIVKELLDAGADISLNDGSGQRLLRVALVNATVEVVKQVLEILSPLSTTSRRCMSEWVTSLPGDGNRLGDRAVSVLRLLLEHGLDPNVCVMDGKITLLDMAMTRQAAGWEALVEDLLSRDARLNLDSAMRLATLRNLDIVLTKLTPLTDACRQQMALWFQRLHTQPKSWSVRDTRVLLLLVEFGLDPDIRQASAPHAPLIVCAAMNGNMELVEKLIAHKAILSASDDDSDTALICAAKNKNRAIYDTLKAAGANDRMFFWTVWTNYAPR
ncbi:MAG: hypothetical protein Q9213_003202 [Squamulea squamosa]